MRVSYTWIELFWFQILKIGTNFDFWNFRILEFSEFLDLIVWRYFSAKNDTFWLIFKHCVMSVLTGNILETWPQSAYKKGKCECFAFAFRYPHLWKGQQQGKKRLHIKKCRCHKTCLSVLCHLSPAIASPILGPTRFCIHDWPSLQEADLKCTCRSRNFGFDIMMIIMHRFQLARKSPIS